MIFDLPFLRTPARHSALALCVAATLSAPVMAAPTAEQQELEQVRATTRALVQALVDQGLISRERGEALLRELAAKSATPPTAAPAAAPVASGAVTAAAASASVPAAPGVVRVPYVSETLKAQMTDEIKNDVLLTARNEGWAAPNQMPDWARRISLEGDIRLRAQGDVFADDNISADLYREQTDSPAWSPDVSNTTHNRKRMTLRARLGVGAVLSESTSAGLRITTVGAPSQVSASQTLGNYSGRLALGLDRAFMRWEPSKNLRVEAGRMATPFMGTDLLWPDDLSLDGASVRLASTVSSGLVASLTMGGFQLEELALSKSDKWLYGIQVGADWALNSKTQLKFGAAYYDFQNVEGVRESSPPPGGSLSGTTPYYTTEYSKLARQRGNTLININDPSNTGAPTWGLASKFKPINLTVGLGLAHFSPVDVGLSLDYVKNSGFDLADIQARAGTSAVDTLANKTTGLQLRGQVGAKRVQERGDWQGFLAYRKFERDAWVDAFTDTTRHGGGTSYKGFSLGGSYGLDRRTWLTLRWTSTRNLDDGYRFEKVPGDPSTLSGNMSSAPLKVDVLQVEVNARF